ncbi:DNA invertase Pin-like site-specific DNA recombinase [Pseudochelatococcus lubricantis]|uniref:DNA invertase Pin-like site-specific DNA recombinase n=1 Tax=Pseudochelatococcus lubricantis TaxID=1538102 RepID=A0ABX0V7N9_9HYPH|nr:recombinase family protein [Pseudochelatococcus lubricantis]NIJ60330.1 DNA invertase Pin-like site-specific DNA recombinase [Pseudochelatococcus lubricantis]
MVRCAIYTRKSSEEGLEQSFNSLDAQREACEAYVASQKSEGWIVLPRMYDDGGFSGGTMDRPALRQLLADVEAGLVDTVVVYKVDRLTRSLGDFAKIVEVFDKAGASFVSVTQSFNTTTSMGRLTLNMLLSFAQFEREVTGERIRDKIAASKAKGIWMGGRPPLGYEARDRKLEIVEAEAQTVQHIFARYAELGSVLDLREELAMAGIVAKRHVSAGGNVTGGGLLGRGAIYHLLQNRLYRGEVRHKGTIYPGQHAAIVDEGLWDRVQAVLAENRVERAVRPDAAAPSLLAGLVRDADGIALTPTHANKKGRHYHYYVSHDLIAGRKGSSVDGPNRRSAARRIPARDLEGIVEGRLTEFLGDASAMDTIVAPRARDVEERREFVARAGDLAHRWPNLSPTERISGLRQLVKTIIVTQDAVTITVRPDAILALVRGVIDTITAGRTVRHEDDGETLTLSVQATLKRVGMEMRHLVDAPQQTANPTAACCGCLPAPSGSAN